jgi:stage IV sporulation protein FB
LLTLSFIILHEISHAIIAKFFGVQIKEITFSCVGLELSVERFYKLNYIKKIIILLAGPFINFIFYLIFRFYIKNNLIACINILLSLFNLLPIYPLDGGKLFIIALQNKFKLRANNFIIIFNCASIIFLFILGIYQIIIFYPNISLIIISIFLFANSINLREKLILNFYYTFFS